ncbi:unnamed protein product [Penicillium salamii]|uniref:Uncharacterized protein n=1 Tax=Penicillium salamii TaxID=1612424 RepID=A0A9W4J036_9EURO|nr:unnamed protein product [Penicillium salamii]CAG8312534.1 unnamed protein product [Penicillium salamii]CAG8339528.1 unnamed protein product [Penicillium salamii]CAG8364062.1 unnamed protein product [Penicillium salamii]CAG8373611.1 unnamed protein product [Penicillium salamii]
MASGFSATPRKEGTWTKLVIFIALYVLIFQSILEWVLVLYLYGNRQVDSKMTLSVVLALVASFFSIPLVGLQSLVAWQYNNIGGFGTQKTVLHNICTYVLRLDLILWLVTSVTGLVVAAQQVYCLPAGTDGSYWRVGISCAFHRASVIVSVTSMVTVCVMYCARELCDRPYDVSLLGIYKRPAILRNGSILSGNSWDSEETLKNEILYLCRQHDGNGTGEFWSVDPIANKVNCHPSIRHPAPARLRPQLRVNTDPGSTYGEIVSGTSISPDENLRRVSPGSQSLTNDFYPISRNSTVMTTQTANELHALLSDAAARQVAAIPEQQSSHKRAKSSLSSIRRMLPKSFPLSLPLLSDPQIQALADPNKASDVEKQVVTPNSMPKGIAQSPTYQLGTANTPNASSTTLPQTANPSPVKPGHVRSTTMNSADAPEVVPESEVHRAQTTNAAPARSIHHPHHPNYTSGPPPRAYSQTSRQTLGAQMRPVQNSQPQRSTSYHFDPSHAPRPNQNKHHPQQRGSQSQYFPPTNRRTSQQRFENNRSAPRRNDVEIIYPSTRRSRSNTHAAGGPLSCIYETSSNPRASVDDHRPVSAVSAVFSELPSSPSNVIDPSTYRGANRTSMSFH